MKNRLISLVLCLLLLSTLALPVRAAEEREFFREEQEAWRLYELGLFKGDDEGSFNLDKPLKRTEAVVMLIRLLGCEQEALEGSWSHPFTDVPQWADKYVGFAYEKGYTRGISKALFGTGSATPAMYLTFLLRALGYEDGADFNWKNPFELFACDNPYITPESKTILRADAVDASWEALSRRMKGQPFTLSKSLIDKGVFSAEKGNEPQMLFPLERVTYETSKGPVQGILYDAHVETFGTLQCIVCLTDTSNPQLEEGLAQNLFRARMNTGSCYVLFLQLPQGKSSWLEAAGELEEVLDQSLANYRLILTELTSGERTAEKVAQALPGRFRGIVDYKDLNTDREDGTLSISDVVSKSGWGVWENRGVKLTVPAQLKDLVTVRTPEEGDLFQVYETRSLVEGTYEGAGWLFSIVPMTAEKLRELNEDPHGERSFISTESGTYLMEGPTDVRLERKGGIGPADTAQWDKLNAWARTVMSEFALDNGSGNVYPTNSLVAMCVADAAVNSKKTATLTTLELDTHTVGGADGSLTAQLISRGYYIPTSDPAPDGEYVVFRLPDYDVRLDFFRAPGNLVRIITGDVETIYRATRFSGQVSGTDAMESWCRALAEAEK
ncbi:MAG: S-layer homology domain-containing protein [Oscillospiraceae bacterium]|nr:S-layer homology domain-containing protein [Oscillospiraceae bacterium]